MSSAVKPELFRVFSLVLILSVGLSYLLLVETQVPAQSGAVLDIYSNVKSLDSLRLAFEGRSSPRMYARLAESDQRDDIGMKTTGVIIPLSANDCVQRQVEALKRIRTLHRIIGEGIAVRVLLMSEFDDESTRMRALLLRKAIRPTFELWYTNEENPLSQAVISKHLEPVLVIRDREVIGVFHAAEYNRIADAASQLLSAYSLN